MARAELEYVSAGCNRSVHAAAWNRERGPGGGLIAYGTHSTVAVYDPAAARVVRTVGRAHDAQVTAVSWLESRDDDDDDDDDDASAAAHGRGRGRGRWMASGGSDGAVLLWHRVDDPRVSTAHEWVVVARGAHGAPVTDVCALEMRGGGGTHDSARPSSSSDSSDSSGVYLLATASQDCTVRMWRADLAALAPRHPAPPPTAASSDPAPASDSDHPDPNAFRVVWTTTTTRKATPTSAALAWLPGAGAARVIAAVGCADGNVRLHLCDVSKVAATDAEEHSCVDVDAEHAATLEGHSDWVRDLAFVEDASDADANAEVDGSNPGVVAVGRSDRSPGLLLASASQDRTARVWRVARMDPRMDPHTNGRTGRMDADPQAPFAFMRLAAPPKPPSRLLGGGARLATHLEALLQGHDDWVLSVAWRPNESNRKSNRNARTNPRPELLTASMDRSLILWTPSASGAGDLAASTAGGSTVWMADVSVGEAAASCLGFYGAAFDALGERILAHSHGGAFHLWTNASSSGPGWTGREWTPGAACTGHVADVTCVAWDSLGRWLLTGSRDMTTRLHAKWMDAKTVGDDGTSTSGWRQLARPQVHGHAVSCVAALAPKAEVDGSNPAVDSSCGSTVFVSGSDEKTLRVFEAPGPFLGTLAKSLGVSGVGVSGAVAALEAAAVAAGLDAGAELPALGLSNKATRAEGSDVEYPPRETPSNTPSSAITEEDDNVGSVVPAVLTRPPPEEVLAQATLWPETRKLYGHGNDLAVVAAHHAGRLVASASAAQSASAAAIWMWAAGEDWRPLGKLPGATLDVVALDFAGPTSGRDCLLAASRDRHVALYAPVNPGNNRGLGVWGDDGWAMVARVRASPKALYDAGWAPGDADAFASAGRDKRVRVWNVNREVAGSNPMEAGVEEAATLPVFRFAVTACRFSPRRTRFGRLALAAGTEDGSVSVWVGGGEGCSTWTIAVRVAAADAHVCAVRAIAWRPEDVDDDDDGADGADRGGAAGTSGAGLGVATAGADHSVRIYRVMLE